MENVFEISALIQRNNEDEAVAIKGYTELLDVVFKSDLENEEKENESLPNEEIARKSLSSFVSSSLHWEPVDLTNCASKTIQNHQKQKK